MLNIFAEGKTFEVAEGANLRESLLNQNIDLYNSAAKVLNCHGHGTCGTCLVKVEGEISEPTLIENIRMAIPPHSGHKDRRLSCQVEVLGDVRVTKFDNFFGEGDQALWTPENASVEVAIAS
jgi:ferredoxin